MPSVAKMIVPSMINGHNHDGHPRQADTAAKSRSEVNDSTKLTVAIPTVSHTAARRLLRTRCSVRIPSSLSSAPRPPSPVSLRTQPRRQRPGELGRTPSAGAEASARSSMG
jgi:hypothetical protein